LGGLGIEIAKNIVLSGVKLLTIFDNHVIKPSDLANQFYLTETDLG
jgi:molybdopterin/thiamine biosynthesis adenylyltransferase